jgi:hypothetical protein
VFIRGLVVNVIELGRFSNKVEFKDVEKIIPRKHRIASTHPSNLKSINYVPISTNGTQILYNNQVFGTREFLDKVFLNSIKQLIVLTQKEHMLILDALIDNGIELSVLEVKFPIFENIKYNSDIKKNYSLLVKKLAKLKSLNVNFGSLAKCFSTKNQYKTERKLRFKNQFDKYFAFAYRGGYQEVFKFKEERSDRIVLALDYNSMFVSCMKGDFLKPKTVKYICFEKSEKNLEPLTSGLYRVILKKPKDTFFKNYHPFKFTLINRSFSFQLSGEESLEILLFKNEVDYYSRFFNSVEVLDGLVSEEVIPHPLYKSACNIYKKRLKARKSGKRELENLYKFQLLTTHSATNPFKLRKISFSSIEKLCDFLAKEFSIDRPSDISIVEFLATLQDKKYFKITFLEGVYHLNCPDFASNDQVHSISAQILANSRLKMMKLIERLIEYPSLEVCYINVDSIHVSIERSRLDDFLHKQKSLISDQLGDLKLQAIGDKGYWFDVGRYWIKSKNNNILAYANIGFNHKGNKKPFLRVRKEMIRNKVGIFEFVKPYYKQLEKSFSFSKKLNFNQGENTCNFKRFAFEDISDVSSLNNTLVDETIKNKLNKIKLFKLISSDYIDR